MCRKENKLISRAIYNSFHFPGPRKLEEVSSYYRVQVNNGILLDIRCINSLSRKMAFLTSIPNPCEFTKLNKIEPGTSTDQSSFDIFGQRGKVHHDHFKISENSN